MNAKRKFQMPTLEEDAEITAAALSDPDAQPLADEQLAAMVPLKPGRGRPRSEASKVPIDLRLSPDVPEALRSTGAG